tara:strand:+ start:1350 stop:2138 length:789 start_codon:yes stop_codon:yes gene_type:complete
MKVNLFFCGDSYTWGEELQGPEQNHARREKERFSNLVAERLGKTYVNISCSGTSNDWIVKKTIEWFEEGNTCDVAIIQFSQEKRWLWYDKSGQTHHMPAKWMERDSYLYANDGKEQAQKAYMSHVAVNDQFSIDNYWKNMFMIRNYLKDKCKVIHLNLGDAPRDRRYRKPEVRNVWYSLVGHDIEIIELKNILKLPVETRISQENRGRWKWYNPNFTRDLKSEVLDNNLNKRFSGSHPSARGHKIIAEKIFEQHPYLLQECS